MLLENTDLLSIFNSLIENPGGVFSPLITHFFAILISSSLNFDINFSSGAYEIDDFIRNIPYWIGGFMISS